MKKLDLTKIDKTYYSAGKQPAVVDLDSYYFLTISGQSAPEDPLFDQAIGKIYALAYAIKFSLKSEDQDFIVPKMEAFWFIKGGPEEQAKFADTPREEWCWKIIIRMPDFVEKAHYTAALSQVATKKKLDVSDVKFELINEGRSVQMMHFGSYDEETPTIEALHQYIVGEGLTIANYHHEIYLSDPRKTAEEKLKTIIRYAVA